MMELSKCSPRKIRGIAIVQILANPALLSWVLHLHRARTMKYTFAVMVALFSLAATSTIMEPLSKNPPCSPESECDAVVQLHGVKTVPIRVV